MLNQPHHAGQVNDHVSDQENRQEYRQERRQFNGDVLLYWTLLGLILLCYTLIVYFSITLAIPVPSGPNELTIRIALNVLAVGALVLTMRPTFRWVRTGVRDLVYGQHESPYPALAQVNLHLESTPSPQTILPTIATTIAETLKLPFVEIEAYRPKVSPLDDPPEIPLTAAFGVQPTGAEIERMPLLYHNIKIGELRVAARRWDVPLSHSDWSVLRELARQVGIALYAAQSTDELQRARERLVLGREEERRRIRNDLHDGLAPTLSALQLQLSAMRRLIRQDPAQAEAQAVELGNDLRAATAEIRQLIYDLRPPMLDELGLIGAIQSFKLNDALRLEVNAPPTLPKLPAALEVALYRIASEALHNVVRHAHATACVVNLEIAAQQITLTITDNGLNHDLNNDLNNGTDNGTQRRDSHPTQYAAGIGLHSMRERAAELNGTLTIQPASPRGTQVIAQLPFEMNTQKVVENG